MVKCPLIITNENLQSGTNQNSGLGSGGFQGLLIFGRKPRGGVLDLRPEFRGGGVLKLRPTFRMGEVPGISYNIVFRYTLF